MKTATPETDAAEASRFTSTTPIVPADFARKLEAERDAARAECAWKPIETAPKDGTPVDLWRKGERLTNYKRVERAPDNVFYDPVAGGLLCVRDATHWKPIPKAPKP